MANNPVLYTKKDHIGYITLSNLSKDNRLDLTMAQELAEICAEVNGDDSVYLVVLTGSGPIFYSGGETVQLASAPDDSLLRISPAEAVASINCPTLASINGDAIGEGLELALSCDLRIASDKARFGLPQIAEGLIPMDGGTQRLSRLVGRGKALEMVLTGEIIDAATALEIGLVNTLADQTSLVFETEALSTTIAKKAPLAMRYAKEAVNKGLDLTLEQGLKLEADLYFLLHTTADRTEGIQSFLQKRSPQYKGK